MGSPKLFELHNKQSKSMAAQIQAAAACQLRLEQAELELSRASKMQTCFIAVYLVVAVLIAGAVMAALWNIGFMIAAILVWVLWFGSRLTDQGHRVTAKELAVTETKKELNRLSALITFSEEADTLNT